MNILFLTLVSIHSFDEEHNIYADLCRCFISQGDCVYLACPNDSAKKTEYIPYNNQNGILRIAIGEIQKTNIISKGINTLLVGSRFKRAIRKHLGDIRFDLAIYSTPPITLYSVVTYIAKREHAVTYLLLKDIFPQNAVDLGMMSKSGVRSIVYRYFRRREKQLYAISDSIGCMSAQNVKYLLEKNSQIDPRKVHVSPNSFDPKLIRVSADEKRKIREMYGIPQNQIVFVYGGNIGRPQNGEFIIRCMQRMSEHSYCYFAICGNGTDYRKLEEYAQVSKQTNLLLIPNMSRQEYEAFVGSCDIGLLFLDYRFTIPNFPSRMLSYMQKCLPVLACTDRATDVGRIIVQGDFGWWCPSNDPGSFCDTVDKACRSDVAALGERAGQYLIEHYSVQESVKIIRNAYSKVKNENT